MKDEPKRESSKMTKSEAVIIEVLLRPVELEQHSENFPSVLLQEIYEMSCKHGFHLEKASVKFCRVNLIPGTQVYESQVHESSISEAFDVRCLY